MTPRYSVAFTLSLLLAIGGCAASADRITDIESRLLSIEKRMEAHEKDLRHISSEHENTKYILSGLDKTLTNVLKELRELAISKAEGGSGGKTDIALEETIQVGELIAQLRDSKEWEPFVEKFRKYGKVATWRLIDYVKAGEKDMKNKASNILALMNPADVVPELLQVATDRSMSMQARLAVVDLLEKMKHPPAVKALEDCLAVQDGAFSWRVALALASCHAELNQKVHDRVVSLLIEALRGDPPWPDLANDALQTLTGKSFGYTLGVSKEENARAIEQWETWWQQKQEKESPESPAVEDKTQEPQSNPFSHDPGKTRQN